LNPFSFFIRQGRGSRLVHTLIMILLVAGLSTSAQATGVDPEVADRILVKLKQGRGDLPYGPVEKSPISGLYKIQVQQGPTLFVSADGSHFVAGEMFSVLPGQFVNLQEQERVKNRADLIAKVDLKDMIVFAPEGETKAVINVFTDVDCGYCRKLHQEVPAYNAMGIEVRYLAYPRAGIPSASYDKIATAWCADDPRDALTRLKNREPLPIKVCDNNPVADQFALGNKMGVRGTPALVLGDGQLIPGYRNASDMARALGLQP